MKIQHIKINQILVKKYLGGYKPETIFLLGEKSDKIMTKNSILI